MRLAHSSILFISPAGLNLMHVMLSGTEQVMYTGRWTTAKSRALIRRSWREHLRVAVAFETAQDQTV